MSEVLPFAQPVPRCQACGNPIGLVTAVYRDDGVYHAVCAPNSPTGDGAPDEAAPGVTHEAHPRLRSSGDPAPADITVEQLAETVGRAIYDNHRAHWNELAPPWDELPEYEEARKGWSREYARNQARAAITATVAAIKGLS